MAQSSSYKQYNRSTRVLTEESGFAGGMLWTGNNIDETHLKAVVNCDYDETTGYLKTRDPFGTADNSPTETDLSTLDIDLRNHYLVGTYNICAFDVNTYDDGVVLGAGWLYIFARANQTPGTLNVSDEDLICIYCIDDTYYKCRISSSYGSKTLRNINASNILLNYDNHLYGLGEYESEYGDDTGVWLYVYRITRKGSTDDGYEYTFEQTSFDKVDDKIDSVTLLEACVSGFNAARKDTFKYEGAETSDDSDRSILGVYMTDDAGNVIASPRVGDVTINIPVRHNPIHKTVNGEQLRYLGIFKLKEGSTITAEGTESIWEHLITLEQDFNVSNAISGRPQNTFRATISCKNKKTTLAFVFYGDMKPTQNTVYGTSVVDYFMPYTITTNDNDSNLKLKNYDLSVCDGSCIWKNRMCVWGTQSSNNCLFLSEVDNFYYYPVPHNVAVFDTNVISCIPYKDSLLVFTANRIYRISENNDGTFTQTVVLNDMPLSRKDSAHLTAIKNMVLFKSGNYFYMIVPKSQSLTDELTVAPIYKNIAGFLNNLDSSVQEVLQLMYPEYLFNQCEVKNSGTPSAVYSEQDTIHILYDISTYVAVADGDTVKQMSRMFKLFLNYNTNLRAWTLYIEDTTTDSLEVSALTAARLMSFIRINTKTGLFEVVIQQPVITPLGSDKPLEVESSIAQPVLVKTPIRLLLDTGYRTLSTAMQKRFREVQLKLYSVSESNTAFGTAFLVDGVWRRNYAKLQEVLTANNTVSLTPALDLNTFVTELSMPITETGDIIKNPGSDAIELSNWTLDLSHFKREAPITIRVPVSGKGYNPRFIFMAPDAAGITINEVNWVYRLMHGR